MNEYTEHHTRRENMPGLTLPDTLNYDTIRSGSTRRWATEHLTRSSGNGLRSNAPRKKPKSRVREMPGSSSAGALRFHLDVARCGLAGHRPYSDGCLPRPGPAVPPGDLRPGDGHRRGDVPGPAAVGGTGQWGGAERTRHRRTLAGQAVTDGAAA